MIPNRKWGVLKMMTLPMILQRNLLSKGVHKYVHRAHKTLGGWKKGDHLNPSPSQNFPPFIPTGYNLHEFSTLQVMQDDILISHMAWKELSFRMRQTVP